MTVRFSIGGPHVLPLEPEDPDRIGDYPLLGRLGAGGQGTVFLGTGHGGRVAVKLLHARLSHDPIARARFVRELTTIERIAGFCTARVHAADLDGDRPYIVSEYVPGASLQQVVREQGPRADGALMRLAVGTATALTAIHQAGVVHRDFKPPNVLMGPDGPRVIDFGIARALDNVGHTMTGQLVGTPAYMAPEQFTEHVVGPASDLFAWGSTMVFAATGRAPFGGGDLYAMLNRMRAEDPDVSGLPEELARPVLACLARDPAARPTADELLWRLLGERREIRLARPFPPGGVTVDDPVTPVEAPVTEVEHTEDLGGLAEPAGTRAGRGPLRRTVPLFLGLALVFLASLLDMASLSVLSSGSVTELRQQWALVLSLVYTSLAVITVFGVIAAWRGFASGVWTIIVVRIVRVAVWLATLGQVPPRTETIVLQVLSPVLVIGLLLLALARGRASAGR
ncbi:serine/threonine-protein kinase [Actinocorallia libanotica]|uniref:Protein kinase domain-containing protein n=1 Tax=Actinocorallia libanotica TaxID=46162 RepID=A0ABP4AWK4_9ACTN